jgi:hypothetical protein
MLGRHTVELLFLMKPAVAANGSVWWNIMDTYNNPHAYPRKCPRAIRRHE